MATQEKSDSLTVFDEATKDLSPEEKEALFKIKKRSDRLSMVYQNAIQELAEDGEVNGYWINVKVHMTGETEKYVSPISGKTHWIDKNVVVKKNRFYRQKLITTSEFNEFVEYAGKTNNELNEEKMQNMSLRLYEYGAKKFLDMDRETYLNALNHEVRKAVDACVHTMKWNGLIGIIAKRKVEKKMREEEEEREEDPNNPTVPRPDSELVGHFLTPTDITIDPKTEKKKLTYAAPDE